MLGQVRSTVENLRDAIGSEEAEFQDMYARFLREARDEGDDEALELWGHILEVERGHYTLFRELLATLLEGRDVAAEPVFVCSTCGKTVLGHQPGPCAICGAAADGFVEVA